MMVMFSKPNCSQGSSLGLWVGLEWMMRCCSGANHGGGGLAGELRTTATCHRGFHL
jgi:hypothetical protein